MTRRKVVLCIDIITNPITTILSRRVAVKSMQMHFPMSYKTITNYICFLYTVSFGLSIGFGCKAASDQGAPRNSSFQQKTYHRQG